MEPVVSLALPVFNGEAYLREALSSIASQTFKNFELVIVDNASTDATPEICRSYAATDARVAYHRLPRNIGAGPNFNHAFGLCRGRYFKWCAHDDLISPNFVERCVSTLESRPDAVLAFGRTECIDDWGEQIEWHESGFMPPLEQDSPAVRMRVALRRHGRCFPVFGLFRADVLRQTTLHRPYYGSDRALLAEIALLGKTVLVEDAVFFNRHHADRSIMIRDRATRRNWQSGAASRGESLENISFLKHLVEISLRHGNPRDRVAAMAEVLKARLRPRYFPKYVLDLLRMVSPSAARRMRIKWLEIFPRQQVDLQKAARSMNGRKTSNKNGEDLNESRYSGRRQGNTTG